MDCRRAWLAVSSGVLAGVCGHDVFQDAIERTYRTVGMDGRHRRLALGICRYIGNNTQE